MGGGPRAAGRAKAAGRTPTTAHLAPTPPPPSQTFHGRQRVAGPGSGPRRDDAWDVVVTVDAVDAARGTLCGTMRADNVPHARGAVETWFSGEVSVALVAREGKRVPALAVRPPAP